MTITTAAPAKVNLTLDIFGVRPDGFHALDSIVVAFTPVDRLTVTIDPTDSNNDEIELVCDDPKLPTGSGNLAYRAAAAFLAHAPNAHASRITIRLEKNLPYEAGLGGGSSDAAAVLIALARCFPVAPSILRAIATTIGSDVPLFLKRSPVRVTGRGEFVEKIALPLPKLFGVFVRPDIGVPTPHAYALLDALPDRKSTATPGLISLLENNPTMTDIAAALRNDFEAAVLPEFPAVDAAYAEVISAGALRALLCGSGSAIFGLARDKQGAEQMASLLKGRLPYVEIAESYEWPDDVE